MGECADPIPCVVFAYNRPARMRRVLRALRRQAIGPLVIFVDGARDENDLAAVERCRALARSVDWTEADVRPRETNRGLDGLSGNVTEILREYESAVFVEDDCLPMPGFYSFVRSALCHYAGSKEVFSVGGYQAIDRRRLQHSGSDLVSSPRFTCWGWGTWRDRWEEMAPHLAAFPDLYHGLAQVPDTAGADLPDMARACAAGTLESWDVKVAIAALYLKKVHLLPTRGLIRNIGLCQGHHGSRQMRRAARRHNRNVDLRRHERTRWLEDLVPDQDYLRALEDFISAVSDAATGAQRHTGGLLRFAANSVRRRGGKR